MEFPPSSVLLEDDPRITTSSSTFGSKSSLRTPSSSQHGVSMVDLSADPIATHLLVETALSDAAPYPVLSVDQLDDLKREADLISARIDTTKRKLKLETRMRDAAASLNRLYSSTTGGGSLSTSSSTVVSPTTNGVPPVPPIPSSISRTSSSSTGSGAGSPRLGFGTRRTSNQSMAPGNHKRVKSESGDRAEAELAETSKKCEELSRELYQLQNRERSARERILRHTAGVLSKTYGNGHGTDNNDSADAGDEVTAVIRFKEEHLAVGKRLGELGAFVRDLLAQVNPDHPFIEASPSAQISQGANRIDFEMFEQIQYIDRALEELLEEPSVAQLLNTQGQNQGYNTFEATLLRQLLELNNKLVQVLHATGDTTSKVPSIRDGLSTQVQFAHNTLTSIARVTKSMSESAQIPQETPTTAKAKLAQYQSTVKSIWQIVVAESQKHTQNDVPGSLSTLFPGNAEFSLPLFATTLKWLLAQSASHGSARADLRERLRDGPTDAVDSAVVDDLTMQLANTKQDHANVQAELGGLHSHLKVAQQRAATLEEEHGTLQRSHDELAGVLETIRTQHSVTSQRNKELEDNYSQLDGIHRDVQRQYSALQARHTELSQTTEKDRTQANTRIAELESQVSASNEGGNSAHLRQELTATLADFEELTRSSVEAEKEREDREREIDRLRDHIEKLEVQLGDEKVTRLGIGARSATAPDGVPMSAGVGGPGGATSSSVLRLEFKKMVRDMRTEYSKHMRNEQEEKRRLEATIRSLKKELGDRKGSGSVLSTPNNTPNGLRSGGKS